MFKNVFGWTLKITGLAIALVFALWLVGFSIYLSTPSSLTDRVYDDFSQDLRDTYSPASKWISRTYRHATRSASDFDPTLIRGSFGQSTDPVFGAIQIWTAVCSAIGSDGTALANLSLSMDLFSNSLLSERMIAKTRVEQTDSLNRSFSLLAIALGLLTTLFAGLNSSEYAQAGNKYAFQIKVLAIFFPACVTAAAALNSLYAGPEIVAKQSQAYFGLVNLGADASSQISGAKCPAATEDFIILNKSINDLNRRLAQLSSGAEKPREKADPPKER